MLTNSYFMRVAGSYFHLGQDIYDFTTSVICKVCWSQVKIATFVVYFKSWISISSNLKRKNSGSGPRLKDEPKFFHMTKHVLPPPGRPQMASSADTSYDRQLRYH